MRGRRGCSLRARAKRIFPKGAAGGNPLRPRTYENSSPPPALGGGPLRPRSFSGGPSEKSGKCDPRSKTITICIQNGAEFRENPKKRSANIGKQRPNGARFPLSRFVSWSPAKRARAKRISAKGGGRRGIFLSARAKRMFPKGAGEEDCP